jgi:hypothetical protein
VKATFNLQRERAGASVGALRLAPFGGSGLSAEASGLSFEELDAER